MTISLHAALVPTFRQMLGALDGVLGRAEAFCDERGIEPATVIAARLAPDMLPFGYQVKSARVHSIQAIEGAEAGRFSPDMSDPPADFAGLRALVADADARLAALAPERVDALVGRPAAFVYGDFRRDFTAEQFLLSFSQPNFFFHVTTAYAILRHLGADVGKLAFLGQLRVLDAQ